MRLVMVATLTTVGACSFVASKGPQAGYESLPYLDCSSNPLPPIVDGAVAAVYLWTALQQRDREGAGELAATLLVMGGFGGSAFYGGHSASSCVDAERALSERIARESKLAPPPPAAQPSKPATAPAPPRTPPDGGSPSVAPDGGSPSVAPDGGSPSVAPDGGKAEP